MISGNAGSHERTRRRYQKPLLWEYLSLCPERFFSWDDVLLRAFIGLLEGGDVELLHLEECLGHPRQLFLVLVSHHCVHRSWNNLPREPVSVLEPATLFRFWYCRELLPIVVYLFLIVAMHNEGDRFVEGKCMHVTAIHGRKPLTFQHKLGKHQLGGLLRRGTGRVGRGDTALGILEYRHIEIDRLACLACVIAREHQRRDDRRAWLAFGLGENQLPRDPVLVLYPTVPLAEGILLKGHESGATYRELLPDGINVFLCILF